MRTTIKNAISETVSELLKAGLGTSFTEKELQGLGVSIPAIQIDKNRIKNIRKRTRASQSVFAKLLNVSPSSIRQWEQGKRQPSGSTKVLLDVLDKTPHVLDYRFERGTVKNKKVA